jgi:Outer membrane protein beta-barrel domain
MKKSFFSTVLCLVVWQIANAQISFAPSTGLNFSKTIITHNPLIHATPIQGYYGGVLMNCPIVDSWAFQSALQYSQKGQIWQFSSNTLKDKAKFHYVDFLPTLEYRMGKNKHLGISTGLNIGVDLFDEVLNNTTGEWHKTIFKFMKTVDLGLLLGMKVYYKDFFLNLSYNQSVLNAGPNYTNEVGEAQPTKTYNQNLQVGIGYFLVSTTKTNVK